MFPENVFNRVQAELPEGQCSAVTRLKYVLWKLCLRCECIPDCGTMFYLPKMTRHVIIASYSQFPNVYIFTDHLRLITDWLSDWLIDYSNRGDYSFRGTQTWICWSKFFKRPDFLFCQTSPPIMPPLRQLISLTKSRYSYASHLPHASHQQINSVHIDLNQNYIQRIPSMWHLICLETQLNHIKTDIKITWTIPSNPH